MNISPNLSFERRTIVVQKFNINRYLKALTPEVLNRHEPSFGDIIGGTFMAT